MRKLFEPPENPFVDYQSQAKFELTWRLFMFNSIFLFLLIFIYWIFDYNAVEESIYAWLATIITHYFFLKTKRYRLIGFIYSMHAIVFLTYTLNYMPEVVHAIEFFWMIVFMLYTFFAIGKREGYFIVLCSVAGMSMYFIFSFEENMEVLMRQAEPPAIIAPVINIAMAVIMIAYLVSQFMRLSQVSEAKFKAANKELQNQNRLVQAQNEEKTIMLKEIHHRVKNNLQVISSLLRLQSYEIDEEKARTHFQDAVYRVVAMALIHEKMYQNKNLSQIDLRDYLKSLADELIRTYGGNTQIDVEIQSKVKFIGNDTLVPVALIFNELITNSLKHAFNTTDRGEILVKLEPEDGSDSFQMIYHDNGEWKHTDKKTSFGLELIATLTEQLDGKVRRTYENGTKYEFLLKNLA